MSKKPNGPITVSESRVHDLLAPLYEKVRRIEITVAVLVVVVASPKLGGPAASDVVTSVLHIFTG